MFGSATLDIVKLLKSCKSFNFPECNLINQSSEAKPPASDAGLDQIIDKCGKRLQLSDTPQQARAVRDNSIMWVHRLSVTQ